MITGTTKAEDDDVVRPPASRFRRLGVFAVRFRWAIAVAWIAATALAVAARQGLSSPGFAMLAFVHLGGGGGLTFVPPLLMFVFSMALGENYNILPMSRIREEARKRREPGEKLI